LCKKSAKTSADQIQEYTVVTKIVIEKGWSQFSIIFVLASQYRSHCPIR